MIWITGGHVLDVHSGRFERLDIGIRGGRIDSLSAPSARRPSRDDRVIEAAGAFIVPGLIDCHVHLTIRSEDADPGAGASRSDPEVAGYAREAARRTLHAGVTSVRDLGGWNYVEMTLRKGVRDGSLVGPRMFLAGRLLSVPTPAAAYYPGMYELVRGQMEVREAVDRQIDRGADVIKVMATGAMLSPEDEDARATQLTRGELRAAVEAAEGRGVPVAAHAHARDGIDNAVEAGVSSIEHGTYADEPVLRKMAERGTFLVPTSCAFATSIPDASMLEAMPAHVRARFEENEETHREAVKRAHRLGVPIAMGTDAGTPGNHHGGNALECVLLVEETGMTPIESIRSATWNAARLLRRQDELGSLEVGKLADIAGCRDDPLADIRELTRIGFVMTGGRVARDELAGSGPA